MVSVSQKIDILNVEWPQSERDFHITAPVLIYLSKKYHLRYKSVNIFCAYYFIIKYRPKMLLISNFSGAEINHEIVKFAYLAGIKVISFISEGNVKPEAYEQFLWGWNHDKILYLDKMLLWSKRSEGIFLKYYPTLKDTLVTTGATGFDRYKLLHFKSKETFLRENNLHYKKIVGIAAWGFDHLFGKYYQEHQDFLKEIYGDAQIALHRNDMYALQKIYYDLIKENPDILFILRYHPGTIDKEKNEFYGLDKYKNVFISDIDNSDKYGISDIINISDIWIGYETTTALEAWLLGKKTFLINPTRSDFVRENVHAGSPIVKSAQEADKIIKTFFLTGTFKSFEQLAAKRKAIIKDVIGFGDGQNYIRAAHVILSEMVPSQQQLKLGLSAYMKSLRQCVKLFLAKTILRKRWRHFLINSNFKESYNRRYDEVIDV